MPLDPVVNFFQSQIATLPVSDIATTIVITTNDGNKLPNPASSGAFNLTIFKDGDPFTDPEIVRVTAKSGDTLTVTRGQEGTIPSTKGASDVWKVVMFPTAKMITDIDSLKVNKAGDTMTGTLSATKLVPTGNVTAGNGMYLPTTNTLALSTNGAERIRITSAGNVGIDTSSPDSTYTMTIEGLATNGLQQLNLKRKGEDQGLKIAAGAGSATYISYEGTDTAFGRHVWRSIKGVTDVERMRIDSSGNVGIGMSPPNAKLQVNGSIGIGSGVIFVGISASRSYSSFSSGNTDIPINFQVAGTTFVSDLFIVNVSLVSPDGINDFRFLQSAVIIRRDNVNASSAVHTISTTSGGSPSTITVSVVSLTQSGCTIRVAFGGKANAVIGLQSISQQGLLSL
jgi:hypothetical protein